MRWAGHVARMSEERGVYRFLVGKPEGKGPLGRPRRRWVDNIKMDLQEVGCGYLDWIRLAQDRDRWRTLVSAVMNIRVPWNAGNFLTSCKQVSFSRRTLHHGVSKYSTFLCHLKKSYILRKSLLLRCFGYFAFWLLPGDKLYWPIIKLLISVSRTRQQNYFTKFCDYHLGTNSAMTINWVINL